MISPLKLLTWERSGPLTCGPAMLEIAVLCRCTIPPLQIALDWDWWTGGGCKFATNILYFETWFCGNLYLCIIACVVWQKPDPFWSVDLESSDFPAGQPETFLSPALHGECSGSFSGWARKWRPIPKASHSHWRTWVCLGVPKNFEEEGQGPEWPPPHPMAESQGRQCPKRPGHGFERSSLDLFSSLVVPNYWVCQVRSHRLGEGRGWAIERGRLGLDFKFWGSIPLILT